LATELVALAGRDHPARRRCCRDAATRRFHTGRIDPAAIVLLAKRYNLDGVVAVTITERRAYPPQRLGIEVELTACDTGLPIWAASLHMDAAGAHTLGPARLVRVEAQQGAARRRWTCALVPATLRRVRRRMSRWRGDLDHGEPTPHD
jgi:hypothetical protein